MSERMTDQQLAEAQKAPSTIGPFGWLRAMNAEREKVGELEGQVQVIEKVSDFNADRNAELETQKATAYSEVEIQCRKVAELEAEKAACNHFLNEAGLGTDMPAKYAELEAENIALSERIGENQRLKNRGIEELNWRLGRAEAKLERVEDLVPPDHPARTQTQRVGNTIFDEILKALGEQQ